MLQKTIIPKTFKLETPDSWKQNPVVDQTANKITTVSLIPYHHSTGLIMRSSGPVTLIGYCVEPPREVLEATFRDYYITRYNGYELFDIGDESTTPMLGLGIDPVQPSRVYGIEYNGILKNLLQLEELLKVKRDEPISHKDVQRIITYLSRKQNAGYINPNSEQSRHNKKEIIDIVKQF